MNDKWQRIWQEGVVGKSGCYFSIRGWRYWEKNEKSQDTWSPSWESNSTYFNYVPAV